MIFGNKELTDKASALQTQLDERETELQAAIAQRDEQAELASVRETERDELAAQVATLTEQATAAQEKIATMQAEIDSMPDRISQEAQRIASAAGHPPLDLPADDPQAAAPKTYPERIAAAKSPLEAAQIRKEWRDSLKPTAKA